MSDETPAKRSDVQPAARDPSGPRQTVADTFEDLRIQLEHLERSIVPGMTSGSQTEHVRPAWQRAGAGEQRLPVAIAMVAAIALQIVLPERLVFHPSWLLPALEGALLIGLVVSNPLRINRSSQLLRAGSIALIALISVANAWSAAFLVWGLISGRGSSDALTLLGSGAAIYLTNIIVFGLWYWEYDRGGPAARARGDDPYPDFLFPQMDKRRLAPPNWAPTILDYLYVSFTNATAFSPTDVMPLSRGAKGIMCVQSCIALITVALVVARAVNVLR